MKRNVLIGILIHLYGFLAIYLVGTIFHQQREQFVHWYVTRPQ